MNCTGACRGTIARRACRTIAQGCGIAATLGFWMHYYPSTRNGLRRNIHHPETPLGFLRFVRPSTQGSRQAATLGCPTKALQAGFDAVHQYKVRSDPKPANTSCAPVSTPCRRGLGTVALVRCSATITLSLRVASPRNVTKGNRTAIGAAGIVLRSVAEQDNACGPRVRLRAPWV